MTPQHAMVAEALDQVIRQMHIVPRDMRVHVLIMTFLVTTNLHKGRLVTPAEMEQARKEVRDTGVVLRDGLCLELHYGEGKVSLSEIDTERMN